MKHEASSQQKARYFLPFDVRSTHVNVQAREGLKKGQFSDLSSSCTSEKYTNMAPSMESFDLPHLATRISAPPLGVLRRDRKHSRVPLWEEREKPVRTQIAPPPAVTAAVRRP